MRSAIVDDSIRVLSNIKADIEVSLLDYRYAAAAIDSSLSQRAVGKVSITGDVWSDRGLQGYLGLTAHYLINRGPESQELELRASLIAFHPLEGAHTGKNLAETTLRLLDRAGITDDKVVSSIL